MKKDWKLYRCIYDEMGLRCVEGQSFDGELFKRLVKEEHYEISWLIGTAIKLDNGNICIRTELEGKKENLELVLEMLGKE